MKNFTFLNKVALLFALTFCLSDVIAQTYTLTDDDVVVEGGVITSCSYSFALTDIIIPQTLDGQTVIGIADGAYSSAGVFYNKGITSVELPASIENIGDNAFYSNHIASLDLSGSTGIISIGEYAFYNNSIATLNLTGCEALTSIDDRAFSYNDLTNVGLSVCTALTSIGEYTFSNNSIVTLDLTGCSNLRYIGYNAFYSNTSLTGFHLPEVSYDGTVCDTWVDGDANSYTAGVDWKPILPHSMFLLSLIHLQTMML